MVARCDAFNLHKFKDIKKMRTELLITLGEDKQSPTKDKQAGAGLQKDNANPSPNVQSTIPSSNEDHFSVYIQGIVSFMRFL